MKLYIKKIIVMLSFTLAAITINAQKVSVVNDDFTGEKIVKTSWEKIYSGGMTGSKQTRMEVYQNGDAQFLKFRIFTDAVCSIDRNAEVMFKINDGVVKAPVTEYSISEPGAWSVNAPNKKLGIYFSVSINLNDLIGKEIQRIRFPLSIGNLDLDINKKDSEKMQKMFKMVNEQ